MLWTIVFPNSQSNRASDKNSRCKKSSCYTRSFVGYTQICLRFPYLDKYSSINYYLDKKKKQNKQTNKLNLAISLKVIPQYCTGHPVLRIKIT